MSKHANTEHFDSESIDHLGIELRRGPELIDKFNELSGFIADMNLPSERKSKLLRSIVELVKIAEMFALAQGIGMGIAPDIYQDAFKLIEPKS